jgi:hypothetical protein
MAMKYINRLITSIGDCARGLPYAVIRSPFSNMLDPVTRGIGEEGECFAKTARPCTR